MPKITKKSFRVQGESVELEVHYNQTNRFHFKGHSIIGNLKTTVNFVNHQNTEDHLYNSMWDALKEYHEIVKKSTKVIVIDYSVGILVSMDKTGPGSYSGKPGFADVTHLSQENGISFNYEVLMKVEKEETEYYRIEEDGQIGWRKRIIEREVVVIDWTEDRELTLKNMAKAANEVALKFHKFMTMEDLPELLEHGQIKLIGS